MKKILRTGLGTSGKVLLLVGIVLIVACYPTPAAPSNAPSAPAPQVSPAGVCVVPAGESRTCNFTDESGQPFLIAVPVQDQKRELMLTKTNAGPTPERKPGIDVTPIRLLFNFDASSGKDKVISFSPPLTITARYNENDVQKVPRKDPAKLTLFLYDGDSKKWTVLKTTVSKDPPTLTALLPSLLGEKDPEGVGY